MMSRRAISLLISSPGDTKLARQAVLDAVEEHNRSPSRRKFPKFAPLTWDKDTVPEAGERAQTVINRQIIDSAEVVIAIFGHRFGTKTGKFQSGTEEEIRRSIANKKRTLVYFLDGSVNLRDISASQLKNVEKFKKEFPGLYGIYSDAADLKAKIYSHLGSISESYVQGIEWARGREKFDPEYLAYSSSVDHTYKCSYAVINRNGDAKVTRLDRFKVKTDYSMSRTCGFMCSTPKSFEFKKPKIKFASNKNIKIRTVIMDSFIQQTGAEVNHQYGWRYQIEPALEFMDYIEIWSEYIVPFSEKDAFSQSGTTFHIQDHMNISDVSFDISVEPTLGRINLIDFWSEDKSGKRKPWTSRNNPIVSSDATKLFWMSDGKRQKNKLVLMYSIT